MTRGWILLPVLTAIALGACGEPSDVTPGAGGQTLSSQSPAVGSPTIPTPGAYPPLDRIKVTSKVAGFLPVLLKPLPDGLPAPLDMADVFAVIAKDPITARFFVTADAIASAKVQLGSLVETDETGKEVSGSQPLTSYVVTGGSSVCVPTGAPGNGTALTGPRPCTAIVIIDANTRQISRAAEIAP